MGHQRDDIIATLQRLGLELRRPEALAPEDGDAFAELTDDEEHPFFILAAEDEQGPAFSHVLHYDAEMIESDDAYAGWVHEWARATGKEDRVTGVASHVNFDGGTSWLEYTLDGEPVRMEFTQDDDWLDPDVADRIITDFGDVSRRSRLYIDGGQGGTYVWLPDESIGEFRQLFPEAERD
ncbi:hypothetical protein [uncultured Corynebacterium sp.]|uniref:hypothetical protein n=1 Tax=uncultured Corynebacterium sp. TaxID=159447 RepID=UPI0025FB4BD8|nr:hypothetical protein [uncultured Corynebacterium sp.]